MNAMSQLANLKDIEQPRYILAEYIACLQASLQAISNASSRRFAQKAPAASPGIRRSCPVGRGLGFVVGSYELFYPVDQLLDAGEAVSPDSALRDDPKPALHLIEPGGVGLRESGAGGPSPRDLYLLMRRWQFSGLP